MGNLLVLPFGIEDRYGTNIANYDLDFDIGFLDLPSQIAAMVTGLIYHMLLVPLSGLGLLAMKWVTQPDELLTMLSDMYRKIVDPLFNIVSFPLLAVLAVGILFLYISIDTVRYTSSFRQDAERIIVGTALALVAVVLARDPFGPVAYVLRSLREIVRDLTRGETLPATTVDSFLSPITQTLGYGEPLGRACAEQWSTALARSGMTATCVSPAESVGFGAPAVVAFAVITALSLLVYAALAVFRMAIHLFGVTWRLAIIPYAVLLTVIQRRKFGTISNLLGTAAAHFVMVLVVLLISLIGPPLFTALMSDIVTGGDEPAGTGRMILGMLVMTLGYGVMTYALNRVSRSSGALARALRLSSQRNLDAHLGAPGSPSGALSAMTGGQRDDLAEKQVTAVTEGSKSLLGALSSKDQDGENAQDTTDPARAGDEGGSGRKAGADVTQDEAVASPFPTAETPDTDVLDEDGEFSTKKGFSVGDATASVAKAAGASSGTAALAGAAAGIAGSLLSGRSREGGAGDEEEGHSPAFIRDETGAVILPEGNPEDRTYFRHRQFSALASGLMVPSGVSGSSVYGRTPVPGEDFTDAQEEGGTDHPAHDFGDAASADAGLAGSGQAHQMPEEPVEGQDGGWDYGYREPSPSTGTDRLPGEVAEDGDQAATAALEDPLPVAPGIVGGGAVPPVSLTPEGAPAPTTTDPGGEDGRQGRDTSADRSPDQGREDYPVLGMTSVGRDMEFLETGEVPTETKAADPQPTTSGLLGSVTTEFRSDDYVEATVSSVPDATFVASRDAAITDSRVISAAMGHGDIMAVPSDDPSMSLTFEVTADGENVVSPKHDFGF